ncbi:hypothetical protein ACQRXC_28745 (plasmid) [Niallia taxi]|uniref:hypothetical protein n=1 Tax=Niallia TaxID=2837506 RepID=UPI0015F6A44A|nr:hypothetical protein [Niallia taxi]MED4057154.1 hypothetical protein [Niallia taxi]MED4122158.1 hypothetical protein [Niallia taxi]
MKKITMMDNLTLYVNKSEYKIEIDEKFTKVSSLDEIEDLEQSLPGFFDVESISRQNNKIYLIYDIPNTYQTLENAKKYVPVIKLQLIKNLLDTDPLLEAEGMTYLDLTNVFFKSFKDIKVLYRSNGYLPYHKDLSTLEQYKLFVLGFYSDKFSYKRFLINKDNLLRKENNEFMFTVNAVTSFAELKTLVDNELEKEQSRFYEKVQFQAISKKKGKKRKFYLWGLGVIVLGLLFAGSVKQVEKSVAAEYRNDIATMKLDNELTFAVSSGDTKKAKELMKKKGDNPEDIATMLVEAGKFDEAIAYDKTIEKYVVSYLYKIGQKEKLLDLKSKSAYLNIEKEIVEFDADDLASKAPLIEDKETLQRLALAFIEHEDFNSAKETLERMKSSESFQLTKSEKKQVDQLLKKSKLEIEISSQNEQISLLNQDDNFAETEEEKAKREKELKESEDKLVDLQKQLIKVDEDLGMDD